MNTQFENGYEPGYYLSHKAEYAKACGYELPNIMIGLYHNEGGCKFEFSINWEEIGKRTTISIRLFNDSWEAFTVFPELFKDLGQLGDISEDNIVEILKKLGFKDKTKYAPLSPGTDLPGEQLGAFRFRVNGAVYQGELEDARRLHRTLKSAQGKSWIDWVDENYHMINNQ